MSRVTELTTNAKSITDYIKDSIFKPFITDYDNGDDYDEQLMDPEVEHLIDELVNDHSVYDKFIKDCIINWHRKRHEFDDVPPLTNQMIDNFLRVHIDSINKEILGKYIPSLKNEIDHKRTSIQSQKDHEYDGRFRNAMNEIKRLHNLKTRKNEKQFKDNETIRKLNDEDRERLWIQYLHNWVPYKDRSKTNTPKLINTFSDKLDNYIADHTLDDKPIDEKQFKDITHGWNPNDKKPIDEWYKEYLKRFDKRNLNVITQENQSINSIGFKSPSKIQALSSVYPNRKPPDTTISSRFPLKMNIRKYQLHKVCPRGTYLIDIMFVDKYYYLVAINVNTRYLFVINGHRQTSSSNRE